MQKTILISAGGTGGHIFPALAVANKLKSEINIIWIGANLGMENEIIPKYGFKLETINISGLRKKGAKRILFLPFMLLRSISQALKLIKLHKPKAIIGFGGYATFPICIAAYLMKIPLLIHEQNSVPGLSNKILSKFAKKILTAFPEVLVSKKTYVVGNPIRQEIRDMSKPSIRYKNRTGGLKLLIVGGSLGAKALNEMLPSICKQLSNIDSVMHQVGSKGDMVFIQKQYKDFGINACVVKFIDNMAQAYTEADLIICRSGASTVSEICAVGIAAIFIPFPHAVDDHQRFNALPLVKIGAAQLIIQDNLTKSKLTELLKNITREDCLKMANLAYSLAIINSTDRISDLIISSINKH